MAPTASVFESPSADERASGFVLGVLNIAMDDITTEMDYFSDEESIMSPRSAMTPSKRVCDAAQVLSVDNLITNPSPIAEESDDNDECYSTPAKISNEDLAPRLLRRTSFGAVISMMKRVAWPVRTQMVWKTLMIC